MLCLLHSDWMVKSSFLSSSSVRLLAMIGVKQQHMTSTRIETYHSNGQDDAFPDVVHAV